MTMTMTLEQYLEQLGINVAGSLIYDLVKKYLAKNERHTLKGLERELIPYLKIENADIKAENIINFLAEKGDIDISGTDIYASRSIVMASDRDTKLVFGNGSSSVTDKSRIEAGNGAQMVMQGRAKMEQDEDGNITFST